ncbi:MAG: DUF3365 domain-containing protein [Sulfuricella sp.]|nr:DUF3365 domain-containing protein [Sulfuricella sp.]
MKKAWLPLALTLAFNLNPAAAADDDLAKFQDDSRKIVKELATQLGGKLQSELKANGPASTIKVCKDIAPAMLSEMSRKTGQRITRVSQKVRNPLLGTPDAWEQKVLADFEKRLEKEKPGMLEFAEVVSEPQGKYLRFMKAIPVQGACLDCHGGSDALDPSVKETLKAEYPHDKATGYTLDQIRGAFSFKKAL